MSLIAGLLGGPAASAVAGFVSRFLPQLIAIAGVLALLLAIVGGIIWLQSSAADGARAECQAGQLRVVVTELQRRISALQEHAADNAERAEKTTLELETLREMVSDYEEIIASRAGDVCVLSDDDSERLRKIR